MVGNTYSYCPKDWLEDIQLASSHGIDGFALNIGRDPWQADRLADAFSAADELASTHFKLFISFDMSSFPGSTLSDARALQVYLDKYTRHPSYLQWNGKAVVSTFAGENCNFGHENSELGWNHVLSTAKPQYKLHFIPAYFSGPHQAAFVGGNFHWNGAWPMGNHPVNFDSDRNHIDKNHGRTYMAAVSPCFFTHYGPDSWNKNWIYRSDDWLYNTRWEMLIDNRRFIDIVQIISWNDYGESHYIGPIRKDQPNSHAWVDGFDHMGWLKMTRYYAMAFKCGVYPTVTRDELFIWARPHASAAVVPNATVPKPNHADWTTDYLWAVVFAIGPSHVTLISGKKSETFRILAGVTKLKFPSHPGRQGATLTRDGVTLIHLAPEWFTFTEHPQSYNFNEYVAFKFA
ncbi:alpha-1,3-glucanase [Hysterangium stoloniferum]|nr:alpha-1,3-glucanase [Hysterangium stoloniferum]